MKKQTVLIHAHLLSEHLKPFDDWYIENKDGIYAISFSGAHNHEHYFHRFDYNRRQYDFYIIPMQRSECEKVGALLAVLRCEKMAPPAAAMPLKKHHRLIIMLKDRGMSNRQIATLLNMTEEAVKQFFKRMAQKFHVRGFHAVIRVARRECAF